MLRLISIRDFAIIDQLELELDTGLSALTGETGAGKSILIDVIGQLLGDRADAGMVREGAEQADLSAEFALPEQGPAAAWLAEQELGGDEDDHVLLRRVLTRQGKSRAWINGRPVAVGQLRTLGEWLVDIHGQHAHQQLLQRETQRHWLDGFLDGHPVADVRDAYRAWRDAARALEQAREAQADTSDRLDLLRFQTGELAELAPVADEYPQLLTEQNQLAHGTEVLTALQTASQQIEDDSGLDAQLGQVLHALQDAAQHDERVNPALELLESARIQIDEAGDTLRRLADGIELDPERLAELDQRVSEYLRLGRKHRVEPETLPGLYDELQTELDALENGDQTVEALEAREQETRATFDTAAAALTRARHQAAERIGQAVTDTMQELGMAGGHFAIGVEPADKPQAHGVDHIEFRVAANPGAAPQPMAKVASGGELSRIGLALQVLASQQQTVPTLIFDEVDSGISGAVAEVVGRKLRTLGERHQVLCVTHLAQVAAQAHHQLEVQKTHAEDGTRTAIQPLDDEHRVEALARLIGGTQLTETTRTHARELLAAAG
ncbi:MULTISPECIES: DNA repair protein RecN [unclassified Thioalkalivibrio]|uniref:DNA repair protein RecN n=1 Tax=unclassified Thioalkalivibrio TaxID=2621013 RepID=UPI00036AF789|nr:MULTISPECIES: DNA repair protein RecN [unclassified Thioalkalivibrio]